MFLWLISVGNVDRHSHSRRDKKNCFHWTTMNLVAVVVDVRDVSMRVDDVTTTQEFATDDVSSTNENLVHSQWRDVSVSSRRQ